MANKVTVDLNNKLIIISEGITNLDTEVDLYSDLKEDWIANANGELGFEFPFESDGGRTLPYGLESGAYFYFKNGIGWRIRPFAADHELFIKGNLYPTDEAYPMFIPATDGHTVVVNLERSSLTQQAIVETGISGLTEEESNQLASISDVQVGVSGIHDKIGEPTSTLFEHITTIESIINDIKDSHWNKMVLTKISDNEYISELYDDNNEVKRTHRLTKDGAVQTKELI